MEDVKNYDITDEAKADAKSVPFDKLFSHYGIYTEETSGSNPMVGFMCPFHTHKHKNSTHSAKWYRLDNQCTCFACSESFDTISFVRKYEGVGFQEAVVKLLELANVADRYIRKKGAVKKKEPYELRYLTNDEKRLLGFTPAGYLADKFAVELLPRQNKTRIYKSYSTDRPPKGELYDVIYEGPEDELVPHYLTYDTISESEMWRDLIQDQVAYRSMVLGHIYVAMELATEILLAGYDIREEDLNILEKAAKDFGYYRVMKKIRQEA